MTPSGLPRVERPKSTELGLFLDMLARAGVSHVIDAQKLAVTVLVAIDPAKPSFSPVFFFEGSDEKLHAVALESTPGL